MRRMMHSLLLTALLAAPCASTLAQGSAGDDIRELDDQVQDLKTEVLDIAAELNVLEQRLLYPSATRVTVSLALAPNTGFDLSAVEVRIDGSLVAHHIYSARELAALQKGGVQTLYIGNIAAGKHELGVSARGEIAPNADFVRTGHHVFTKGAGARALDITVDPAGPADSGIRIDER